MEFLLDASGKHRLPGKEEGRHSMGLATLGNTHMHTHTHSPK